MARPRVTAARVHRGKPSATVGEPRVAVRPTVGPASRQRSPASRPVRTARRYPRSVASPTPEPRVAAFFDLDKTVIAKASMVAFSRPLHRAGMLSRRMMLRAAWGQILYAQFGATPEKLEKLRESVLQLTKGWDQAEISAIVRETLGEVIEPIVYDEALDRIRAHQAWGHKVFIVSASPEEVVAPIASSSGSTRRSPPGPSSTTTAATPVAPSATSTPTRRWSPSRRWPCATASTSTTAGPTRTRPPTSRCSPRSVTRWP